MESLVHKYLTNFYTVHIVPNENYHTPSYPKIYDRYDEVKYWDTLSKELINVFDITPDEAKNYVGKWAYKQNVDLFNYWDLNSFEALAFPIIGRTAIRTVAMDLVPVQPLELPKGLLIYLGYNYKKETRFDKFKRKIRDIYKRIIRFIQN